MLLIIDRSAPPEKEFLPEVMTAPLIAAPVSWANTSRRSGSAPPWGPASRKTGVPSGT